MSINNVEIQDSNGNVYYPHTDASIVKFGETTVGASLSERAKQIDLSNHLADLVTDSDGAHGLKFESGTFTPNITGTNVYSVQTGKYKKINNIVYFSLKITMSTKDANTPAMDLFVGGLPFTPIENMSIPSPIIQNLSYDSGKQIIAVVQTSANIKFQYTVTGQPSYRVQSSALTNTTTFEIAGFYFV